MRTNVGAIDKALRIVIGLGLLALLVLLEGGARWWGLAGIVPLATALIGYCPLYALLGLSSCPLEKKQA